MSQELVILGERHLRGNENHLRFIHRHQIAICLLGFGSLNFLPIPTWTHFTLRSLQCFEGL